MLGSKDTRRPAAVVVVEDDFRVQAGGLGFYINERFRFPGHGGAGNIGGGRHLFVDGAEQGDFFVVDAAGGHGGGVVVIKGEGQFVFERVTDDDVPVTGAELIGRFADNGDAEDFQIMNIDSNGVTGRFEDSPPYGAGGSQFFNGKALLLTKV